MNCPPYVPYIFDDILKVNMSRAVQFVTVSVLFSFLRKLSERDGGRGCVGEGLERVKRKA